MLYTIMLVVLVIIWLFIFERFGSESTQSFSVSQCFLSSGEFFAFELACKWNISCTVVDSPYVYRRVLRLFLLSRTEGGFTREENPHQAMDLLDF